MKDEEDDDLRDIPVDDIADLARVFSSLVISSASCKRVRARGMCVHARTEVDVR